LKIIFAITDQIDFVTDKILLPLNEPQEVAKFIVEMMEKINQLYI